MSTKKTESTIFSNRTFRQVFQSSVEGIIIVDQQGLIQLCNPVSEKMFGYESGELIGVGVEQLINQRLRQDHLKHRESFNQHPTPRKMGAASNLLALRKDDVEFPVEISLSHVMIKDQLYITAFIIDITERKQVEDALRHSEEQLLLYAVELEKKVSARTEDLNNIVKELEAANDSLQEQIVERKRAEEEAKRSLEKERELNELKTKFVSIASHEFRTPLSSVLGSVSLIDQYKDLGDMDKIGKHVSRIKSSVNHLTGILNDFLSLGKLEEGKIERHHEPISLCEFMDEVKDEISPMLKKQQQLLLHFEGEEALLVTDPQVLRNILFNLLSNASKYSEENGIIEVSTKYSKNEVSILVKDEGIGIPEEEQKNLFDRFFRASNSNNSEGTGLGLHIVKRYLNLLGGTITFTSKENEGSTFTVKLPTHK